MSDEKLLDLRMVKDQITKGNQAQTAKQEMALESEKYEQKMSREREIYEQQLMFQKVLGTGQQNQAKKALSTKLPKLSITQFDGKCLNWLFFWNKFVAEIDSAELSAVTKFAYLNKIKDPWVQKCNSFQVDMQVETILSSSQKEAHQQRLDKLRQELDYIKTDAWKYKPIEDLIGF